MRAAFRSCRPKRAAAMTSAVTTSRYASTTHCTIAKVVCSACTSVGSATLTMLASSVNMNTPVQSPASPSQRVFAALVRSLDCAGSIYAPSLCIFGGLHCNRAQRTACR
jgi:hypothetical protein